MFYDDDIDTFFNSDEFAVIATKNGKGFNVIFDDDFSSVNVFDTNFSGQSLVVRVANKDFYGFGLQRNDILTIQSIDYIVRETQFNLSGVTTLILQYNETKDTSQKFDDNGFIID